MEYVGMFLGFLFWIVVIVVAYPYLKKFMAQNKTQSEGKTALDIAKERYAKGEITKEEFEEIKEHLS